MFLKLLISLTTKIPLLDRDKTHAIKCSWQNETTEFWKLKHPKFLQSCVSRAFLAYYLDGLKKEKKKFKGLVYITQEFVFLTGDSQSNYRIQG